MVQKSWVRMEDGAGSRLRRQADVERQTRFAQELFAFLLSPSSFFNFFSSASGHDSPGLRWSLDSSCPFSEASLPSSDSVGVDVCVLPLVFCWWPLHPLTGSSSPLRALPLPITATQSPTSAQASALQSQISTGHCQLDAP